MRGRLTVRSRRSAIATVVPLGCVALVASCGLVAGCGRVQPAAWRTPPASDQSAAAATPAPPSAAPAASPVPQSSAAPSASCAAGTSWDCDQQRRFAAATALIARKAGKLGVVVHDRGTGAVWRSGTTDNTTWTASTIKLGIAAAVLEWNRSGKITIDSTDRTNLSAALVDSSNDAATALWDRYGGQPMFDRFRTTYGMDSLAVVSGYSLFWRNLRCSAEDLHNLMVYVLDRLHLDDRVYLIDKLRGVASNQQWGVWAAGASLRPGNKDGWVEKPDTGGSHWVTHSVGFAGPGERYVVAVTYSLPRPGTLSDGIHAVSDVVATVFGAPVPARVTGP